jgi:hypothetical protein
MACAHGQADLNMRVAVAFTGWLDADASHVRAHAAAGCAAAPPSGNDSDRPLIFTRFPAGWHALHSRIRACSASLVQEPDAPFGLVDPVFQDACRCDIAIFIAEFMDPTHFPR